MSDIWFAPAVVPDQYALARSEPAKLVSRSAILVIAEVSSTIGSV